MRRIEKLLIASRGEIARRIARTARAMGIATVAVYAEPDRGAPFVAEADEAVALGGARPAETYLDAATLIEAAKRSGAGAVHPGYGFLSENAEFARAVLAAGLTWVGPAPATIAAMGDKLAAKRLMAAAGVETLPSVAVAGLSPADLAGEAARLGYPLLVKAAAGGGGRGMRVVRNARELADGVAGARREAAGTGGDDRVFLEPCLERCRHVEVQLLGDADGHLVHCFERECSIQRRHQKIVEESPAPGLGDEVRERMYAAALAAGRALDYVSAGTVEFIVDDEGRFYFLEVNTRLQVEHPVTEALTGLDLVREQLRIAQGECLGYGQRDVARAGHAIEARLYAEDPAPGLPARARAGARVGAACGPAGARRCRRRERQRGVGALRSPARQGDRARADARRGGGPPGARARAAPRARGDDEPRASWPRPRGSSTGSATTAPRSTTSRRRSASPRPRSTTTSRTRRSCSSSAAGSRSRSASRGSAGRSRRSRHPTSSSGSRSPATSRA